MVKNYMEVLVDEIFNEVKYLYKTCTSEKCIHDIKSAALNNLSPCYFPYNTKESEKKAFLLERQRRIKVLAQIAEAEHKVCSQCQSKNKVQDNK